MKRCLLWVPFVLAALAAAPACSGEETDPPVGDDDDDDDDGTPPPEGDWVKLIDSEWSMRAGGEGYHCQRLTVTEDLYIRGFRAISPTGTHHTVVGLQDPDGPDGGFPCQVGTLSDHMIFASGVGTDALVFPEGIAFHVPAGKQLLLNIHLFNYEDTTATGVAGTEVMLVDEAEVDAFAETVFAGTFNILLPAGQTTTVHGRCDFTHDATIVSVWPHMHQLGTHMKVAHVAHATGGGETMLHDAPFDFNDQINYLIEPTMVRAGDSVEVECTYHNTTGGLVTFGDSSTQEMCFAGLYRYPAAPGGTGLFCTDGDGL